MLTPMISDNSLPWMNVKRTSSLLLLSPLSLCRAVGTGGGWVDFVGSCLFMFVHVQSCSIMFAFVCSCLFIHVRKCLFMFVHVCSSLFMLIHFVSCLFIFVHLCSCLFLFFPEIMLPRIFKPSYGPKSWLPFGCRT